MMTNLFSIFDPSSSIGNNLNWLALYLIIVVSPLMKWVTPSRGMKGFQTLFKTLTLEVKPLLNLEARMMMGLFMSLFLLILTMNSMGLISYIFTPSSHLTITLGLALPMWLSYFSYGWVKKTKWMLAHLVPQSTPNVLMPFMVLIESISSLIRPLTLSVRLAANMIAGHLLLTLMSNTISIFKGTAGVSIVVMQIALVILETAVAAIQAYVFMILSALYVSEI
uniref:ATP synthase subunit a n=1 Tax=Oniscus asellus TaxID=96861 RepID=A0A1P8DKF1_ONIAS|nr:ATP synthase subunit 6 [Oniscus asellus]